MYTIDNKEFKKQYGLTFNTIFRKCCLICKTTDDAQSATTDTFMNAWEHRNEFKSDIHLLKFLYTTSKNICLNQLKRKVRLIKTVELGHMNCAEELPAVEMSKANVLIITEGIESLPNKCREVFKMRVLGKMNYTDIGVILKMNNHSVACRYFQAIKLLIERVKLIYE